MAYEDNHCACKTTPGRAFLPWSSNRCKSKGNFIGRPGFSSGLGLWSQPSRSLANQPLSSLANRLSVPSPADSLPLPINSPPINQLPFRQPESSLRQPEFSLRQPASSLRSPECRTFRFPIAFWSRRPVRLFPLPARPRSARPELTKSLESSS